MNTRQLIGQDVMTSPLMTSRMFEAAADDVTVTFNIHTRHQLSK